MCLFKTTVSLYVQIIVTSYISLSSYEHHTVSATIMLHYIFSTCTTYIVKHNANFHSNFLKTYLDKCTCKFLSNGTILSDTRHAMITIQKFGMTLSKAFSGSKQDGFILKTYDMRTPYYEQDRV